MSAVAWRLACVVAVSSVVMPALGQESGPPPTGPEPTRTEAAQPDSKPDAKKESSIESTGNKPGPAHQRLAKLVGEWETASKFTMPGQAAVESTGASRFSSILGGRFLSEDDRGTMNGAEFQSQKLWGFNSESQKYESVWTYTGATSMMIMTGVSKDEGKTVVYDASYEGARGRRAQMVVTMKVADDDHFSITIAPKLPEGESAPAFESSYTRKK